jgi:hypothetical protein
MAAEHQGACDDGDLDATDLEWRVVPDLPLATVEGCLVRGSRRRDQALSILWRKWHEGECRLDDEEFDGGREWKALVDEEVREPIVVVIEAGRVQIWDGWHRTGASIVAGRTTIPAIVGTHPDVPADADLMALCAAFRADPHLGGIATI